ncbi:DUF3499 domain-containing protein [Glycomyces sp. L485]|nr:DUF3499 domain-containing protein [Glycomyces sp. L485]
MATLTYIYSDSTAVVGPLATTREPHSYDLCDTHARRLTVPHGWELVRHQGDYTAPMPTDDDLVALANAVREAATTERAEPEPDPAKPSGRQLGEPPEPAPRQGMRPTAPPMSARRHLRVVSGDEDAGR